MAVSFEKHVENYQFRLEVIVSFGDRCLEWRLRLYQVKDEMAGEEAKVTLLESHSWPLSLILNKRKECCYLPPKKEIRQWLIGHQAKILWGAADKALQQIDEALRQSSTLLL